MSGVLDGYAVDMSLIDHYAYVVGGDVWIIDISDPTKPRPVGNLDTPGDYAYDITVVDDRLFVADGYGGLVILRVRD